MMKKMVFRLNHPKREHLVPPAARVDIDASEIIEWHANLVVRNHKLDFCNVSIGAPDVKRRARRCTLCRKNLNNVSNRAQFTRVPGASLRTHMFLLKFSGELICVWLEICVSTIISLLITFCKIIWDKIESSILVSIIRATARPPGPVYIVLKSFMCHSTVNTLFVLEIFSSVDL